MSALITIDHVRKAHGAVVALDDVSVSIDRGEYVAIVGPSGSGKTTLLSLMGGLDRPTSGSVHAFDQPLSTLSTSAVTRIRARHMGFVFQLFHLIPYLSVLDNVRAVPAATADRAQAVLTELGLADRLRHRPGQLSVGERQRVGLARALVSAPDVILADEPTGNLDPAAESEVSRVLDAYHAQGGTVVLVTHSDTMAARAGRTIRLEAGRCVETT